MVVGKLLGEFLNLRRRRLQSLFAEGRHQFVGIGALGFEFFQARRIGFHLDRRARLGKNRLFGKVREHENERRRRFAGRFIDEATALDTNRIDLGQSAVESVNVEFALVQVLELAFEFETLATAAASHENKAEKEQNGLFHLFSGFISEIGTPNPCRRSFSASNQGEVPLSSTILRQIYCRDEPPRLRGDNSSARRDS